jgi:hypothetical protein
MQVREKCVDAQVCELINCRNKVTESNFTNTTNYSSSQSMALSDSLHSLLDYACLPFHCDEWRTKNSYSHIELPWTTSVRRITPTSESECYVTTDGQSASLSWNQALIWGLNTTLVLLSDSCGFVDVGRSLWREDGSVICNCCWSLPAWDSRPLYQIRDFPPTTRRATVEVLDPASTEWIRNLL